MTDAPDPQQQLDELASAHLDGLTTPDEAARIAADPVLQARVAELARVRAAVAQVEPPLDDPEREAAIAAALAAFDEDRAGGAVVPLARGRRPPPSRTLRYAAIAAAVVLAALVVPLLSSLDSGEDDQATTLEETGAAITEEGADRSAADAGAGAGGASPQAGTTDDDVTTLAASDLGAFAEHAELEAAVRDRLASPSSFSDAEGAPSPTTAVATARACFDRSPGSGTLVLETTATLAGTPVVVTVVDRPDGTRTLTVYDSTDCRLVSTTRL